MKILGIIAGKDKNLTARKFAVEKINDQKVLEKLAQNNINGDVREAAAKKLASLLPKEYASYYLSCYQEFDEKVTSEAKYADCMDKLQPFLHNALTEGFTWKNATPPTVATQVYQRMSILKDFMPEVYLWVEKSIEHAIQNNWLVDK